MSKLVRRNDHCPCGSGKKYKKCCLGKADDPEFTNSENFIDNYKEGRKRARFKECIHPDQTHCSEKIIGAHTIQNNKILSRISDNGELYMPCPKPDLQPSFQYKYGRKEATTFTGFCGYHDKITFQPIEDFVFTGTEEQVFLHIYRTFALEYHKKKEVSRMQRAFFASLPSIANMQGYFREGKTGDQMAVSDYEKDKEIFDQAILNKEYSVLTYFVWSFDGFSNFAATGGETPTKDFDGNYLQNLTDFSVPARHIYLCVFPENNKTYAIIAWFKRDDKLFDSIKKRLSSFTEKEKQNFINNTIAITCENIVIKPSAWDAFDKNEKKQFEELFARSMFSPSLVGNMGGRADKPLFDLFSI